MKQYPSRLKYKKNHKLNFNKLADFKPDNLIQQIPYLRQLISMRNLLKDLKANIIDNNTFRKSLEKIAQNKSELLQLQQDIQQKSPLIKNEE